jgi:hypothetical protein
MEIVTIPLRSSRQRITTPYFDAYNHGVIGNVASEELSRTLRRRGALILAVAGLVWVSVGTSGTTATAIGRVATPAVAIAITVAAIVLAIRSGSRPAPPRRLPDDWLRKAGLVNLGQLVGIAVAVAVLIATGLSALVPAVVCLIFGLHFLPLARLFGQWQYRWTGLLLCLTGVAGIIVYLGGSGRLSGSVVGIGTAVILWGTSVHVATHSSSASAGSAPPPGRPAPSGR